jgi:hypothetical protein
MPASLATTEAFIVIGAGAAATAIFVIGLLNDNNIHALAGLAGYLAVWAYGLMRASYT